MFKHIHYNITNRYLKSACYWPLHCSAKIKTKSTIASWRLVIHCIVLGCVGTSLYVCIYEHKKNTIQQRKYSI